MVWTLNLWDLMLPTDSWHKNWVHCKILRAVWVFLGGRKPPHVWWSEIPEVFSKVLAMMCCIVKSEEVFFFLWRIFLAFHVCPLYIFWLYLVATLGLAIYILNLSIYSGQYFTTSLLKFSVLSPHFLIFSLLYSILQDLSFWNVIIYNIII